MERHVSLTDFVDGVKNMSDAIWEIDLKNGHVFIWNDSIYPEWIGSSVCYDSFFNEFIREYIYPQDIGNWREYMSIGSLQSFAGAKSPSAKFEARFAFNNKPMRWYEITRHNAPESDYSKVLVYFKFIGYDRRNQIVSEAVKSDYDYVIYLEAEANSYIMYTYYSDAKTRLPAPVSDNYFEEMQKFTEKYCLKAQLDTILSHLTIEFILSEMEKKGEHVFYFFMVDSGNRPSYKKLRYSWFDEEKKILLMTRIDVTAAYEGERQKELLQNALDAANVASSAKSIFLSRMSHDIRTPLNAILGMAAVAEMHIDQKEYIEDCLQKITYSSKHLLLLLNDILDMSKIESGKDTVNKGDFTIDELVQSLYPIVLPSIQENNHHFKADFLNIKHKDVIGDLYRIQQVLINLLTNATKYTQPGGSVKLTIEEVPSSVNGYGCYIFTVEDNGIGIKSEFIPLLFDPFVRANDTNVKKIEGTGLGLAICKSLVEMMGGDIHVESQYGHGSKFVVALSLKYQHPDENVPSLEKKSYLSDKKPNFTGKTILLVEDNLLNMEIGKELIGYTGATVEKAENGKIAVDKVAASPEGYYSLIFMDIQMPIMDGFAATMAIRALERSDARKVPIVALTANAFVEDVQMALRAGMNQHVAKPISRDGITDVILKWLS